MDLKSRETRVFVLVALFAGGLLLALVLWQRERVGALAARQQLDTVHAVQRQFEQRQQADLERRAWMLAHDPAFVGYIAQALGGLPGAAVDIHSTFDLLEERRGQLGLDAAAVLDAEGNVLVTTRPLAAKAGFAQEPLFVSAREKLGVRSGAWRDGDRLLHLAIMPLAPDGLGEGYLLIADALGQPQAQALAGATGSEVALVASTESGVQVLAATLDADQRKALAPKVAALAGSDATTVVAIGGQRMLASRSPLFGSERAQLLAFAPMATSIAMASLLPLLVACALVLALLVGAAWWWRSAVARPAEALRGLMERVAAGDHHTHSIEQGAEPIRRLEQAFNHLTRHLIRQS